MNTYTDSDTGFAFFSEGGVGESGEGEMKSVTFRKGMTIWKLKSVEANN